MKVLKNHGIQNALVEGGGDILVSNPPPGQMAWKIISEDKQQTFFLKNQAIASSGNNYQYLEWNGKKYSHLIHPKTGYGISDKKIVSVIANKCSDADALASICSLLSESSLQKFRKNKKWKIYISK